MLYEIVSEIIHKFMHDRNSCIKEPITISDLLIDRWVSTYAMQKKSKMGSKKFNMALDSIRNHENIISMTKHAGTYWSLKHFEGFENSGFKDYIKSTNSIS